MSFVAPPVQAQQRPPEILWASHPANRAVDGVNSPITSVYPGASVSDADGNLFVTGTFNGVVSLGGNALTNTVPGFTAGDVLLIKYAPDGQVLWTRQAGGNYSDEGRSLALDGAGGVYLSGTTGSDNALFGTNSISAGAETGMFLARYDGNGNCQWVRRAGSWQATWSSPINSASVTDSGLAVDSAGNALVGGQFKGNPMFNGTRIFSQFSQLIYTNGLVLTNRAVNTEDLFLAKYSPAGNLLWATNHGSTNGEYASALALDSSDNIYTSGGFTKNTLLGGAFYTNSMFLAKFSPTGVPVWSRNLSEPTNNNLGTALSVVVDSANRATVAFSTAMPIFRLGTNSFTNEVQSPNFSGITGSGLAQFDANGALLWMKRAPFNVNGSSGLVGLTLARDTADNLYLRAAANLMTNRFALGDPGLSVLKLQPDGAALWTNVVKNGPFQMTLGDGQGVSVGFFKRGLPGLSVAPNGRLAVLANIYGDRTTPGYIGWTNLLAFTNGTGNNLLTYSIESNYVGVLPQFIVQPTNMVFQPPQGLTNYALARAWPVADYRWFMVTNGIGGRVGTNQFFTLLPTTVANVTTYFVVASNLLGQTTGAVVFARPLLAILPATNPTNSILLGGSGTLSANATGTTAISYQWRFNGTNLDGATGATLVLNNATTNANGLYTVVACNAWGCLTSAPPITVNVVRPGSMDPSFATGLTGEYALARQSDGRLLGIGGGIYPTFYRALTNGPLDASFYVRPPELGGTVFWWRSGSFDQEGPRTLVQEPNGRIVVGGNFNRFFTNYPAGGQGYFGKMVRLNADGTFDPGFNVGGGPDVGSIGSLLRQPDGQLIAAGTFKTFNGFGRTNLVRLNPDGSVDGTFTSQTFAYGTDYNNAGGVSALALQPDGKILVGGNWQRVSGQDRPVLIRLNTNGTLDESFVVMRVKNSSSTWPANGFCSVSSIALLPSGKILIAGNGLRLAQTGYDNNALFQLNADGTVDTNFVAQATGGVTLSTAVAVQSDGKILLAGSPTVNRFLPGGAADPDWLFDLVLANGTFGNAPCSTSRILIEPGGATALMAGNYGIRRILLRSELGAPTQPNFPTGSAVRLPNGQFGFTTCGQTGQTLVIQGSTNLTDWVSLQTNVVGSGCIDFIDTQAPLIPNRYYRVVIP